MRTKTKRKLKIEIAENTITLDEALGNIAKIIAAGMLREEQRKREEGGDAP